MSFSVSRVTFFNRTEEGKVTAEVTFEVDPQDIYDQKGNLVRYLTATVSVTEQTMFRSVELARAQLSESWDKAPSTLTLSQVDFASRARRWWQVWFHIFGGSYSVSLTLPSEESSLEEYSADSVSTVAELAKIQATRKLRGFAQEIAHG